MDIGPSELLIVLIVLLVVFGGSKIPKLARNLGQAQSEFKKGLSQASESSDTAPASPAAPAAPADTAPTSFAPPPPPPTGSGCTAL